jgi:citronellol/citronellal dehydrogenase
MVHHISILIRSKFASNLQKKAEPGQRAAKKIHTCNRKTTGMNMLGKTAVITGGSRGIGQAIALRYAAAGANIVILTKDAPAHIENTTDQVIAAGGQILVLDTNVCDAHALMQAVRQAVDRFGGIDILVNNTSATCLEDILHMTPEQFDTVLATSVRAAFFLAQGCHPYLIKAPNPHLINISPPLNLDPCWFKNHLAFSLGKYAISMSTLGMAEQFKPDGIAVNSLWPKTTIATQTLKDHFLPKVYASSRWPSIMGDAAYALALRNSRQCTGCFFTDESLLQEEGITDFSGYAVDPDSPLMQAFFLPAEETQSQGTQELFLKSSAK